MPVSRHERIRDERGYTLVELLMATIGGLLVAAAALAILVTSLQFSINDGDRVDANQEGSAAMERIVQALNSSCVEGAGVSPIVGATGGTGLTGSTGAAVSSSGTLTFYSSLSDAPTITPNEITISLSAGQLVMKTYQYSSTLQGYPATPTTTAVLLSHAGATSGQALFTYTAYNQTTGALSSGLTGTPTLGSTGATETAAVGVNLSSQPSNGDSAVGDSVDLNDAVTLRLTSAPNGTASGSTGSTVPTPCL